MSGENKRVRTKGSGIFFVHVKRDLTPFIPLHYEGTTQHQINHCQTQTQNVHHKATPPFQLYLFEKFFFADNKNMKN
jgi:hypothetical protein